MAISPALRPDSVARLLESALGGHFGSATRIDSIEQRSEGWSQYTFVVTGEARGESIEWVVRLDPGRNMWNDAESLERQHRVLSGLVGQGVPAPAPIAYLPSVEGLSTPALVMERLPGEAIVPWSRRGREVLAAGRASKLYREFIRILVAIHTSAWSAADVRRLSAGDAAAGTFAMCEARRWRQLLGQALWRSDPVAELTLVWIADNFPKQLRTGLVHGDYRTGNLLFEDGRITGILDWESADWGDPVADIGYVCAPPHVIDGLCCGLTTQAEMVGAYEEYSRTRVPSDSLRFFRVLATLKNHAIWVQAGAQALRGEASDLRTARGVMAAQNLRAMLVGLLLDSQDDRFTVEDHPIIESPATLCRLQQLADQGLVTGVSHDSFGAGQMRAAEAVSAAVASANRPDSVSRYREALIATGGDVDADLAELETALVKRIRRHSHAGASREPWFADVLAVLAIQFGEG